MDVIRYLIQSAELKSERVQEIVDSISVSPQSRSPLRSLLSPCYNQRSPAPFHQSNRRNGISQNLVDDGERQDHALFWNPVFQPFDDLGKLCRDIRIVIGIHGEIVER